MVFLQGKDDDIRKSQFGKVTLFDDNWWENVDYILKIQGYLVFTRCFLTSYVGLHKFIDILFFVAIIVHNG